MTQDNIFKEALEYFKDGQIEDKPIILALTICDYLLQKPVMDNSETIVAEGTFIIRTVMKSTIEQLMNGFINDRKN